MWLFLVPALVINVGVLLVPAVLTFLLAFTKWDGLGTPSWVGLANLRDVLTDPLTWTALLHNVIWTGLFLTIPVFIGLVVAAMLLFRQRSRNLLQAIYFIPYILATVIIARVWQGMIYSPVTGVFGWLNSVGIGISNPLTQTSSSLYGVAAVDMWHWWGFLAVVFFAALRQVDISLIDAARVEGAGFWQLFRRILLPIIRPTIFFMFIMTVIWSFIVFDFVYVLTEGGPGYSSEVLATLAYKNAFYQFQVGRASALALIMGVLGLSAIAGYIWLQVREGEI